MISPEKPFLEGPISTSFRRIFWQVAGFSCLASWWSRCLCAASVARSAPSSEFGRRTRKGTRKSTRKPTAGEQMRHKCVTNASQMRHKRARLKMGGIPRSKIQNWSKSINRHSITQISININMQSIAEPFFLWSKERKEMALLNGSFEWLLVSVSVRIVGLQLQLSSHHSLPRCETKNTTCYRHVREIWRFSTFSTYIQLVLLQFCYTLFLNIFR